MTALAHARTAVLALSLGLAATPLPAQWSDPATADAEMMPRASHGLLLDATALAGGRLVVVGERGHVLVSDDQGGSWQQVPVPTRSTLTSVAAAADLVVAGGHNGVILRSTDAGSSWDRVREDVLDATSDDPTNGAPILDVFFLDDQRVLAIGAYSLVLASADGGATWQAQPMLLADAEPAADGADAAAGDAAEDAGDGDADADADADGDELLFDESELMMYAEEDPHLNAIARLGDGRLFVVAERGASFLSDDEGATWQRRPLPYDGSMFGLLALDGGRALAFGLRGNALASDDNGSSWRLLDTGTDLSLFGAVRAEDGGVLLVGSNGVLVRVDPELSDFQPRLVPETGTLAGLLDGGDGRLILYGENGLQHLGATP